jgi:hypothetical protein
MGPSEVGVSLSSPENGRKSSFRKVVFSSLSEFRMIDKVLEPNYSECFTPLSQPFRFYNIRGLRFSE